MIGTCPERELCAPSPWRDAVIGLARDHRAGLVPGWPDRYAASVVDGVRYLIRESEECDARLMEPRWRNDVVG